MRGPGHCAVTHGVCTKRARMSEIEGELDREKGSGDVEEGGVLLAAGNYGGRISLLTCRKQNFKRLSPGSLTQTHRHTHHPPCVFAPCPHPDSSHTLGYSELHQCISGVRVCVCAPRGHNKDRPDDFSGLELCRNLSYTSLVLSLWML